MASPDVVLVVRLLRWGNSFGLRISRADVQRAGLKLDQDLTVRIAPTSDKIDLSHLPTFEDRRDASENLDAMRADDQDSRIRRWSRGTRCRQ